MTHTDARFSNSLFTLCRRGPDVSFETWLCHSPSRRRRGWSAWAADAQECDAMILPAARRTMFDSSVGAMTTASPP